MSIIQRPAPDWAIERWFNATVPLDLASLRGRVVLIGAFQMLCPGCVERLIPQLKEAHETFDAKHLAVIGLHTVFEHHAAMTPVSLDAFLKEYRVRFPVGVDEAGPAGDPLPVTMRRYAMQGTPTTVLIDRQGRLRRQVFGHVADLRLGAEIDGLMRQDAADGARVGDVSMATEGGTCRVGHGIRGG